MNLACPSCGAHASADAWANDVEVRGVFAITTQMPGPVIRRFLPYLALFRPPTRSLSWRRVKTVASELGDLVRTGTVKIGRVDAIPCPSEIWGQAIDLVLDRAESGGLDRPLKNHRYLMTIARDLAGKAATVRARTDERRAAGAENRREERRRSGVRDESTGERTMPSDARQALETFGLKPRALPAPDPFDD